MLETPSIRRYSFMSVARDSVANMSSDNPSGADDQQERLAHSSWLDRIPEDVGHYVAGFVDGEGSFNVPIRRERDRSMPWRIGLTFNVSQIGTEVLDHLRSVFGVGTIRDRPDGVYYFEVTKVEHLEERIFPFFERFPLRGPSETIWRSSVRSRSSSDDVSTSRPEASNVSL